MPTIIVKVDLECCRCHAKIKKVLDRIREKGEFVIDDIKYEKNGRVIVTGPFDAVKLADKLCCKACNIIKEIEIVEPESSKKGKPESSKKGESDPPPPDTKTKLPQEEEKVNQKPPQPKVVEVPYPCPYPYPFPAWPSGCCCHHGHGGCHCCTCARQNPPPAPAPQYIVLPPYPCGGYTMVCEEDPPGACAIM